MATLQGGNSISTFDKFFKAGGDEMQVLVNSAFADMYNESWWKQMYQKADMPTPLDAYGKATFTAYQVIKTSAPMAMPRAKWSPPAEGSHDGFASYTGSLYDYGFSFVTTAQQRDYYSKMLDAFNGNTTILKKFMSETDDLIKGIHSRISNIGASLLSQGYYLTEGAGVKAKGKADIPLSRFKTAGAKAWSDVGADILGKMQTEVQALRDATGFSGVLSFKMDKTAWGYVQANTAVKSTIPSYLSSIGVLESLNSTVTVERFNRWVNEVGMNYAIIELVEEKQVLQDTVISRRDVHGWKSGSVVLSPFGYQGTIEYANVDELAILSEIGDRQIAYVEDGLFGLMNWVSGKNDRSPAWVTEVLGTFAPALGVAHTMTIIDSKTADS